ncbi:MAG: hypothetical protein AMJ43_05820 [Coxiella sp. DG_40]|nr:MAG: hypothetical protein AMJ43_05820 [Coxiella sp. DG_40]
MKRFFKSCTVDNNTFPIETKLIGFVYSLTDTPEGIERKLNEILSLREEHDLLYTLVERYGMSWEDYNQRTRTRLQYDKHFYIGLYNQDTKECLAIAGCTPDETHNLMGIDNFVVREEYRNLCLGTKLFQVTCEIAKQKGFQKVGLTPYFLVMEKGEKQEFKGALPEGSGVFYSINGINPVGVRMEVDLNECAKFLDPCEKINRLKNAVREWESLVYTIQEHNIKPLKRKLKKLTQELETGMPNDEKTTAKPPSLGFFTHDKSQLGNKEDPGDSLTLRL